METVNGLYNFLSSELTGLFGPEETRSILTILFEKYLNLSRVDIAVKGDRPVTAGVKDKFLNALEELKIHKPVQYIIHEAWFHGMKLFVDENVLIPRRETEELAGWIVSDLPAAPDVIVDVCTGSGCLAIYLKRKFPASRVIGIDISTPALNIARRNAIDNHAEIEWMQADVLLSLPPVKAGLIVSNPPYVLRKEARSMAKRVTDFEPSLALFVPDNDPLVFYSAISKWAFDQCKGGTIYYELNEAMGNEICDLHVRAGFADYWLKDDLQGKARFFKAVIPQ